MGSRRRRLLDGEQLEEPDEREPRRRRAEHGRRERGRVGAGQEGAGARRPGRGHVAAVGQERDVLGAGALERGDAAHHDVGIALEGHPERFGERAQRVPSPVAHRRYGFFPFPESWS